VRVEVAVVKRRWDQKEIDLILSTLSKWFPLLMLGLEPLAISPETSPYPQSSEQQSYVLRFPSCNNGHMEKRFQYPEAANDVWNAGGGKGV
jgi:hypothetical protein